MTTRERVRFMVEAAGNNSKDSQSRCSNMLMRKSLEKKVTE